MAVQYFRARPLISVSLRSFRQTRLPINYKPNLGDRISQQYASTSSTGGTSRLRVYLLGGSVAASAAAIYFYATDTRASFHQYVVPPLIRFLFPDAEDAHHAGTVALKNLYSVGLHPRERPQPGDPEASSLSVSVFGTSLLNPMGISAGLDKDADIPDPLFALGAAVVEVGGCTPLPQDGNPKPRVWRVPSVDGMVNRYGLNSRGADAMAARLRDRLRKFALSLGLTEQELLDGQGSADIPIGSLRPGRLLLVQIAKNKTTDEKDVNAVIRDYVYCVKRLAPYADVLVVNVSSPNTPGLRDLQATEPLTKLLSAVVDEAQRSDRKVKPKVMVKVSPDEDDDTQVIGVVEAVCTSGVDGVIVGNTTKRRSGIIPPGVKLNAKDREALVEDGGFSGPLMFGRTLDLVKKYRMVLDSYSYELAAPEASSSDTAAPTADKPSSGSTNKSEPEQKVLFATGGITNGEQALKVLNAGASVAMVYTGMVYGGSGTVTRIKGEMKKELTKQDA